jgi:hypothetical protein
MPIIHWYPTAGGRITELIFITQPSAADTGPEVITGNEPGLMLSQSLCRGK